MMQNLLLFLAGSLLSYAWLSPSYSYPWTSFNSDFASFTAGMALLLIVLFQDLKVPRIQTWMFLVVTIPIVQWIVGLVSDFSIAFLSACYLFGFWIMIVLGFNLSLEPKQRELLMQGFSNFTFKIAVVCSLMAILQWLHLEFYVYGIMQLYGNRPYANFGQPNNLATFLILGFLGGLYLFEKGKINSKTYIFYGCFILFAITLTQSRTSWIVFIFVLIYFYYKSSLYGQQFKLKFYKLFILALGYFIFSGYLFSYISNWIEINTRVDIVHTFSIAERTSSGYERFGMWLQILHAISQRPWLGYGWNQTSIAVVESIQFNTVHIWFNSAHNILLDILVWNGIPLGGGIILYNIIWLFWLNKNAKDITSIIAILMISAILIHAMFEFPQRYACFLLPMGFLLGVIQAQTPNLKCVNLRKFVTRSVFYSGILLLLLIWRDCRFLQNNSQLIFRYKPVTATFLGSPKVLLLTQFQKDLDWIAMSTKTKLSDDELKRIDEMVKNKATQYNLKKYAQVLLFNGKKDEAKKQIVILEKLYNQKEDLDSINLTLN